MLMELYDSSFLRIGVLNSYTMVQYTEQLNDLGEFEIDVAASEIDKQTLDDTKYILFEPDVMGAVHTIHSTDDVTQDLQIKGYMANGILSMRVIPATQTINGTRSAIARQTVTNNFINPTNSKRKIQLVTLGTYPTSDTESIRKQQTGGYVSEFLTELFNDIDMGYKITPVVGNTYDQQGEIETNISQLRFDVIKGTDHSFDNTGNNDIVEFSQDLRNLLSTDFTLSEAKYKNLIYVAGEAQEDTEEPRVILEIPVGTEESGLDRFELYVDARDLQSTYTQEVKNADGVIETIERSYTSTQYEEMLRKRAFEKVSEYIKEEIFEAQIDTNRTQFVYGVDYKLGDYVSVVDANLGIRAKCLVNEVTITSMANEVKIDIQFGKPTLSWMKKLRRV